MTLTPTDKASVLNKCLPNGCPCCGSSNLMTANEFRASYGADNVSSLNPSRLLQFHCPQCLTATCLRLDPEGYLESVSMNGPEVGSVEVTVTDAETKAQP